MINIISKSYYSRHVSGPKKVVDNFIKGLKLLGYPYAVNKQLDACQRLWIHDDVRALKAASSLPKETKVVVGPNLFVLPGNIPLGFNLSGMIYLQPSLWVKNLWLELGFNNCPIEIWPVGVDTAQFIPVPGKKRLVLVYYKQRKAEELAQVEKILKEKGIAYQVISYGHYKQDEYQNLLAQSRYILWLGRSESQGLALLEALSCGVPALVCDMSENPFNKGGVSNSGGNLYNEVTCAPYFDGSCGIKIRGLDGLNKAITEMEAGADFFRPRIYVEQNLGPMRQAEALLKIYENNFNLAKDTATAQSVLAAGDWVNNSYAYRLGFLIKDILKSLK